MNSGDKVKLKAWQIALLLVVAFMGFSLFLGGSGQTEGPNPESSQPSSEVVDLEAQSAYAIEMVQERYVDCLAQLPIQGEWVYTPKPTDEVQDRGEALITIPGGVLTFGTGTAPGGAFLTAPIDEETTEILASVGC